MSNAVIIPRYDTPIREVIGETATLSARGQSGKACCKMQHSVSFGGEDGLLERIVSGLRNRR